MDNIFEKVKSAADIADVVERFGVKLDRNGKGLCPFHKEDTPSFSVKRGENIFKCFGCGESGDAVDFVAKIKSIEKIEAAKFLAEIYACEPPMAVKGGVKRTVPTPKQPRATNQNPNNGIKDYILACEKDISQTDYFFKRGLNEQTIKQFRLGYDAKKKCVVIPYSSKLDYFQTRSVEGKEFRKPPTEQAGQEPLWGAKNLLSDGAVFVTESPICAMSIAQCGGQAVSVCGATGGQKLINALPKKTRCTLVLCYDNDEPGRKAQQDLANSLFELNVKFIPYNIAGDCKDPNELLVKDHMALNRNIAAAVRAARDKFRTDKDSFSAEELFSWPLVPPKWVVENLIYEGLTILCAPSKFGKSWLVMNLCLAVAEGKDVMALRTDKTDCLYYSLEDPPYRLRKRLALLLNGKRPPKEINFVTNADKLGSGFLDKVQSELKANPKIGFVVVDTLQKIRAVNTNSSRDVYGHDYEEMGQLKKFADQNKIALVVVHHTRKMKDEDDVFNTVLGSGGIAGTADTTIILSRNKRFNEETKISVTGRDIEEREFMARLDRNTFVWQMCGDAKELEAQRIRSEYENDTVVKTVKALIERQPYGWTGTASDLLKAYYDIFNEAPSDTPDGIGRKIKKWEQKLYYDGIDHKEQRSGKERKHGFFKRSYKNPQGTLFGEKEDD